MSYNNPVSNESPRESVGLDASLKVLYEAFNEINWLNGNVFLRAYTNTFPDVEGKERSEPVVYMGDNEYYTPLLNDNLPCTLFFKTRGSEKIDYDKPDRSRSISYERPMSLIFWCNLHTLDAFFSSDSIYTEQIKEKLISILAPQPCVKSITDYFDDSVEEVFQGYDMPNNRKQYGKYPYACLRIDFVINYLTGVIPC